MSELIDGLGYLKEIKTEIMDALNTKGATLTTETPFRDYAGAVTGLPTEAPPSPPVRPTDWLALPEVLDTDQKVVGLYAVHDSHINVVEFTISGNYTVDWGDGVVEDYNAGVKASHAFDYNYAGFTGTETTEGYKQAIVTITPQAGQNLTSLDFIYSTIGSATNYWVEFVMAGSNVSYLRVKDLTSLRFFNFKGVNALTALSQTFYSCYALESIENLYTAGISDFSNMFFGCHSLKHIPQIDTSSGTNFSNMFNACYSISSIPLLNTSIGENFSGMFRDCHTLTTIPQIDTSSGTNFSTMFFECHSLSSVPEINTSLGTAFISMFGNCKSLTSIPALNTSSGTGTGFMSMFKDCESLKTIPLIVTSGGTNFNDMFSGCISLISVPALDTSSATSMSNMFYSCYSLAYIPPLNTSGVTSIGSLFWNCRSLKHVPLMDFSNVTSFSNVFTGSTRLSRIQMENVKTTISVASLRLSREALVEIFTNLATLTISYTITISGNYGAADLTADDRLIATSKNWAISG